MLWVLRRGKWVAGRLTAGMSLVGLIILSGTVANAQQTVEGEAWVYPSSVTPDGGTVTYQMQVGVPTAELPVTITSVVSDVYGDVADPANPAILSTSCVIPVDWQPDSNFAWALGWGCGFEVWVEGPPGEVATTISATVLLGDGTEVVVADVAVVTISSELGAIHGVLIDSVTGTPVPDVIVTADCTPCGGFADGQGRFALEGLQLGEYRLGAGNSEHGVSDYAFEFYDDAPDQESATPVLVFPGEVTDLEWGLSFGGVIEGTVSDEVSGEPIAGAGVTPVMVLEDGTRQLFISGSETGAAGSYRIGGLITADYALCFGKSGYEPECWNSRSSAGRNPFDSPADPIHVELGQTVGGIDVTLTPIVEGTDGLVNGEGDDRTTLPFTGTSAGPLALFAIGLVAAGAAAARGPGVSIWPKPMSGSRERNYGGEGD